MLTTRSVVSIFPAAMMVLGAGGVLGQDYPNKPIRIVTSSPGGGSDIMSRIIAQAITGPLGQNVIVVNSRHNHETVAKALPDGYTVLLASSSFVLGPLFEPLQYDPVRDFAPIIMTGQAPNVMAVHPSLPVPINSVKELIALAKARPGALNYGSSSPGSSTHLAAELFKSMAGVNIVGIPYDGAGAAVIGLMAGETQMIIASLTSAMPHVKSGKLRALAVTSLQPSALAPGLPAVAASGVPGYEFAGFDAIFAPAKTPAAIINRLNREIVRFLRTKEGTEKFLSNGLEVVGSSPEELGIKVKSEQAKWGKLLKDVKDALVKTK